MRGDFLWSDEAACAAMAGRWAGTLKPMLQAGGSAIIELRGTLGAGKTTFTRYLLRALGVQGRIKSPSYAVVEPHEAEGGLAIWHFDFYRFNDPQEWEDAGFRDLFGAAGLKLVEWPDKAAGLLPEPDLRLHLTPLDEDRRQVRVEAATDQGQAWLSPWIATDSGGFAHG
jgi:tRNA threonylcarbamoyladenosine biosynthesis protein TsaE